MGNTIPCPPKFCAPILRDQRTPWSREFYTGPRNSKPKRACKPPMKKDPNCQAEKYPLKLTVAPPDANAQLQPATTKNPTPKSPNFMGGSKRHYQPAHEPNRHAKCRFLRGRCQPLWYTPRYTPRYPLCKMLRIVKNLTIFLV